MEILQSKKISLIFAIFNGVFALQAFSYGNWIWGSLCLLCCGWATYNYKNGEQQ